MGEAQDFPATRADIGRLDGKIDVLDDKIDKLDDKIDTSIKRLDDRIDKLDDKIDRLDDKVDVVTAHLTKAIMETRRDLAFQIERTQNDVRRIEATMSTKDDIGRVMSAIDSFTGKVRNAESASILHGQVLTDVQVALKDHERRISGLEGR